MTIGRKPGDVLDATHFASSYLARIRQLLDRVDLREVDRAIALLEQARTRGATIFIIGNGGSASTASHFATDLSFGVRKQGGPAYRALSLTDNAALITAAANDLGYDTVFVEQLKSLMVAGDLVVAISASGNSPNVVRAVEYARSHGAETIGFTGFDGGRLRQIVTRAVHVDAPVGEYGPVEDLHLILEHLMTAFLRQAHAAAPGAALGLTGVPLVPHEG